MDYRLHYVMKNFRLNYQVKEVRIDYGQDSDDAVICIRQHADDSFFENRKDLNTKKIVWKEWKGVRIPFCFDIDDSEEIISQCNNKVYINYDIIASSFYFLSGWNEYVNPQRDSLERVAFESSIMKELGISHIPVVNYYFDILYEALLKVNGINIKPLWGNHSFGVALTHDIDTCLSAWMEGSFSELKKGKLFSIPKLLIYHLVGRDDWFNFQKIADIEKQYGASSTFFFLSKKGKFNQWKNADYDIGSKRLQHVIRSLTEQGFEIGVHGSFGTFNNSNELRNDIQRICSTSIIGNRFHFLMFDPAKSPQVLEESGIKYDTTLGFAEQIGFRRATCFPFYLFDFSKNQCSDVLELPLVVMDASLHYTKYMGISKQESLKAVIELIKEVQKFNGVFTLLWHNTFFSDYKYTGWKDIYIEILRYCRENNALMANGKELYTRIANQ